jgi:L-arabinose isomerase
MSRLKIQKNKEKIVKLLNENIDLEYNLRLKSYKRISEEIRNIGTKKQPKEVNVKIGYWIEWFKDESRPNDKGFKVERQEIFEVNGQKSDGWNRISYYTIDDI